MLFAKGARRGSSIVMGLRLWEEWLIAAGAAIWDIAALRSGMINFSDRYGSTLRITRSADPTKFWIHVAVFTSLAIGFGIHAAIRSLA
jgi:hypothetical protein